MTLHEAAQHLIARPQSARRPRTRVLQFVNDRFLWLPLGASIALVWANTAAESYFSVAQALRFPVNDIGMALFLGLITQEVVEAIMPGGSLHTWRRWSMPLIASGGGILGAAFVYLTYVSWGRETVLVQAWPVACAIDIAAGYYVLAAIFRRSGALPFLLLTGIMTNAAGLVILALQPAFTADRLTGAVILLAAVSLAALLRRLNVRTFSPYLVYCGTMSWLAFYWAGVHPALALVPIAPFLPHEPRRLDVFAEPPDDEVHLAEHRWTAAVQVVLFLFGLVNAGVILRGHDTGTVAILAAALVGRPLGIVIAMALASAAGFQLPRQIGWRELAVIALATSCGFTFALFTAASLLPIGGVLAQVKIGALATCLGAPVTYGAARLLHVGRFASTQHP